MQKYISSKKKLYNNTDLEENKLGKLQLIYLWFGQNLSCLSVICNLALYLPEVSLVKVL